MLKDIGSQHQTICHHTTMKTLVVLSALVCVATAAPAADQNDGVFLTVGTSGNFNPINFESEIGGPEPSARSHFDIKSPIIVKKKNGYHMYRDSTEERANADPRDNCSKHLRVKVCDENIAAKSTDLRRSTKIENNNDNTDNVEASIKIAKEAVDSIQQDLKNIEHGTSGKTAEWKHGKSDKNMHEDIEVAKHALEHAQKKFGKLESMNLRATTLSDSEALHDASLGKTEEERMAQWKAAMETIQKNVELARNIEDSFRSGSSFSQAEAIDTTHLMRSDNHEHKHDFHKSSAKESSVMTSDVKVGSSNQKMMEKKSEHHMTSELRTHENIANDMKSAASETHVKNEQASHVVHNSQSTQGKLAEVSLNIQSQPLDLKHSSSIGLSKGKSVELDSSLRASHAGVNMEQPHATLMSMKNEHTESGHHNKESSLRTSESSHHVSAMHKDQSSHMAKAGAHSFEHHKVDTMHQGKGFATQFEAISSNRHLKHGKSAWADTENKDTMMKAADHKNMELNTDIQLGHSKSSFAEHDSKLTATLKSADSEHTSEHMKHFKDNAAGFDKTSGVAVHTDMKLADNTEMASGITFNGPIDLDHSVKVDFDKSKLEKSADVTEDLHMDQLRHAHGLSHLHGQSHGHELLHGHGIPHSYGHGHMHSSAPLLHHYNQHGLIGHGHGHGHLSSHHGGLYHGKSVEDDSEMHPSVQTNVRETALENKMFQWKHHDTARSYGAGAGLGYGDGAALSLSPGSGGPAVGVFPHAKLGGCGIPLLLSCSPSVVSGSLAKSHGYGAPAYRNEEDFKLKNKRDIIKTNDVAGTKIRHSTKTAQPKNLEKKF